MAEIVSSAVVGETMNRIVSSLIGKHEEEFDERDNIERMEMAHIKMEAALEMSNKWQITDAPLLRWRSKLKRASQECDDTLHHCKQRALEDEEIRKGVSRSSFPKRIAHATKSFISSFISRSNDESSSSSVNVRRFERFADGANEFLKFVEFGGTPRQYMFFNPLIGHLLTGKTLSYQALQGSKFYYLGIRPMSFADRGVEAMVGFVLQDFKAPAKSFSLGFMLRLSESTDIFGIVIKCMQSVTPHFKFAAEDIRRELIELPTQDFSWVTHSPYGENKYWVDVHNTLTQWFRSNPLCCNGHEHNLITSSTSNTNASSSSRLAVASIFPEQVIVVHLQCHISLPDHDLHKSRQNSAPEHGQRSYLNSGLSHLKLGVLFIPHDSPDDVEPAAESYAFEVIDEKEQEMVHRNACLQDVDEKLLPKAVDYLCQNAESRMYQMCLRSRHGTAHLCVEKTSTQKQSARRCKNKTTRQAPYRGVGQKREKYSKQGWQEVSRDLLKLWVVRASDKLHGSIRSWIVNSARRN